MANRYNLIDISGRKFGRWLAIRPDETAARRRRWICRCECGVERSVMQQTLLNGAGRSCGCYQRELPPSTLRHGHARGGRYTRAYVAWTSMLRRCKADPDYAGRGITVCERWRSFENFHEDMGDPPAGTSLDRKNVNGHYEAGNCRWAGAEMQQRNKRKTTLTPEKVREIWRLRASLGMGPLGIARAISSTRGAVAGVLTGITWREFQPPQIAR